MDTAKSIVTSGDKVPKEEELDEVGCSVPIAEGAVDVPGVKTRIEGVGLESLAWELASGSSVSGVRRGAGLVLAEYRPDEVDGVDEFNLRLLRLRSPMGSVVLPLTTSPSERGVARLLVEDAPPGVDVDE